MADLERLQEEAKYAELVKITLRVPLSWVAGFDELSEAIGVTRSEVIREAMLSGLRELEDQWASAKKQKKKPRGA